MSLAVIVVIVVGAVALVIAGIVGVAVWRLLRGHQQVADAVIDHAGEHTTIDPDTGAVTSVQAADLTMAVAELEAIWTPMHLERLARTYWRFLSRCTLGLIRVRYTEAERFVCLIGRPLVLLQFRAPEYQMDDREGIVRWRIEKGVLVSRRGSSGAGYLKIDIVRRPSDEAARGTLHVEVSVANFYPAIAFRLGRWVYTNTQSRIHVIVTHGFLRSLARLDLAHSRVGRYTTVDDVPDPVSEPREPVLKPGV
jgi:hypothetical protein